MKTLNEIKIISLNYNTDNNTGSGLVFHEDVGSVLYEYRTNKGHEICDIRIIKTTKPLRDDIYSAISNLTENYSKKQVSVLI